MALNLLLPPHACTRSINVYAHNCLYGSAKCKMFAQLFQILAKTLDRDGEQPQMRLGRTIHAQHFAIGRYIWFLTPFLIVSAR